jgi:ketosteroid isomerase-like protein
MTTTDAKVAPAGSPTATVQALYAAFGAGDLDAMLALIHPDVDWSLQVDAPGAERVPMFRNGRGHDAVRHYFSGVDRLDFRRFEPQMIVEQGDTVLVVLAIEVAHRDTGKSTAFEEIHRFRVRTDGRIYAYRPFLDTTRLIELYQP